MATVNIKKQDGSYERVADTLGAVVSQNVNYSIDEVRTGTWINGKPVYSRVYTFSLTTSNTTSSVYNRTQYATLPADVEDVIKIEGMFIDPTEGMVLPLPWAMPISASRGINYGVVANPNTKRIDFVYWLASPATDGGKLLQVRARISYTKTTD